MLEKAPLPKERSVMIQSLHSMETQYSNDLRVNDDELDDDDPIKLLDQLRDLALNFGVKKEEVHFAKILYRANRCLIDTIYYGPSALILLYQLAKGKIRWETFGHAVGLSALMYVILLGVNVWRKETSGGTAETTSQTLEINRNQWQDLESELEFARSELIAHLRFLNLIDDSAVQTLSSIQLDELAKEVSDYYNEEEVTNGRCSRVIHPSSSEVIVSVPITTSRPRTLDAV